MNEEPIHEYQMSTERHDVEYQLATVYYDYGIPVKVQKMIDDCCDRLWKPTKELREYKEQIESIEELSEEEKSTAIGDFVRVKYRIK